MEKKRDVKKEQEQQKRIKYEVGQEIGIFDHTESDPPEQENKSP